MRYSGVEIELLEENLDALLLILSQLLVLMKPGTTKIVAQWCSQGSRRNFLKKIQRPKSRCALALILYNVVVILLF
jgi:hypothetical protein